MKPATLISALLRLQGAWETPPGADWNLEVSRVRELIPELENSINTRLRLDDRVEDASFFGDLGVLTQQPTEGGVIYLHYRVCFRFSWFCRMVTIFGNNTDEYDIDRALQALKEHGYVYVSETELEEPYDGLNDPYQPGLTWWVRFFDYL